MTSPRKTDRATRSGTADSKSGRTVDSKTRRVVLFPTEPSIIGKRKIQQAVDRVTSKK
jgi:hypothetical protein